MPAAEPFTRWPRPLHADLGGTPQVRPDWPDMACIFDFPDGWFVEAWLSCPVALCFARSAHLWICQHAATPHCCANRNARTDEHDVLDDVLAFQCGRIWNASAHLPWKE